MRWQTLEPFYLGAKKSRYRQEQLKALASVKIVQYKYASDIIPTHSKVWLSLAEQGTW